MDTPHTAPDYQRGCRCPSCTSRHNEAGKAYAKATRVQVRQMKAELTRLQAFEARVLAAVGQGSTT